MQKIYYCLLNSGDKNVESAAFRLLNDFENRNNKFIRKTSIGNSFRKSARPSQDSLMNIPE